MSQLTGQQVLQTLRHRGKQIVGLYAAVLIPMWLMFALNNTLLFGRWNRLGIIPRSLEPSSLIGVVASWTMHGNFAHLLGNTLALIQILFLFGLFERYAYRTIAFLIVASGLMTWGLGSPMSMHIGASGLAFAMLGFMIGGAVFARRWGYLIACILMGAGFWLTIKQGLIPQAGISFAGHFGGLCVGLLIGAKSNHMYPAIGRR